MTPIDSKKPRLALASKSARRLELLCEAGYDAVAVPSGFDDADTPNVGSPEALVTELARRKAAAVLDRPALAAAGRIVIGADTIAVSPRSHQSDGQPELLGQPTDRDEAQRMLRLMLGTTHQILTGVALLDPATGRTHVYHEAADVLLGHIPEDKLQAYLDTEAWRGKAGAYNLFEIQNDWPVDITGDPTTIVGMPMGTLGKHLAAFVKK